MLYGSNQTEDLRKEDLIFLKVDTMCSLSSLNIGSLADFFNTKKNALDNSGTHLKRGFWSVANMIYIQSKSLSGKQRKKIISGLFKGAWKKPEQVRATYSKSLHDSNGKSSWGRLDFQREGLFPYQMGRFQTQHPTPAMDSEALRSTSACQSRIPKAWQVLRADAVCGTGQWKVYPTLIEEVYLPNVFWSL